MWSLLIAEGRSYDVMLRTAQLALAIERQEQIHVDFEKDDVYAPWRHLLAPNEQLLLRTMGDAGRTGSSSVANLISLANASRDNTSGAYWQQGSDSLAAGYLQSLVCRPATGIGARLPQDTWLLLTGAVANVQVEQLRDYQRVLAVAPYVPASGLPGVVILPPAVDTRLFAPDPAAQPPDRLLIIGSGDPGADLAFIASWQKTHGCPPCTFFDAYHGETLLRRWGLPDAVGYIGACAAPARAEQFRACTAVVAVADVVYCDNHFLWEAVAAGAKPLAHWSGMPAASQHGWDPAHRAAALANIGTQPPLPSVPQVVHWQDIPPLLKQAPAAQAATTAPHHVALAPHQVHLYASGPTFKTKQVKPTAGVAPVAMIVPGAAAWDASLRSRLGRYSEIYVDISEGTAFFVGCITEILDRPVQSIDQFEPTLHQILQRSIAAHVDIVHLANDAQRLHHHQHILDGLAQRWGAPQSGSRTPTLVIHTQKPFVRAGPSKRRIGVGVATDVIVNGMDGDSRGRYQMRWLSRQPTDSERGRVYLYPLPSKVGLDKDEIDYPALPGMLERDEIDMLCGIDPYLSGLVAARATWAKRAVPVVGMLHSIHPNSGVTDTVFQLANGASLPVDTIISPTQCGADSYQGLLDAASEWLGHFTPTPPRYAGKIEVIPYGIETAHYDGLHKPACRLALDIPQDAVVLLSFGRFARQEKSDLTPLLLAFQKLHRKYPQTLLVLAGARQSPSYIGQLRELSHRLGIAEAVEFKVEIDASDKTLYYGAADIFVTPSDNIQETYGLTLLEAMAAGLPTVASGWNGYREIVRHGESGFLVKTYGSNISKTPQQVLRIAEGTLGYGHRDLHESVIVDPEALLHALEALVQNPALRRTMGEAGQRVCRTDYEQATQARRTGDYLLERIREAAHTPWPVPTVCAPYYDLVSERFANYPMNGNVAPEQCVGPGAWHDGGGHQAAIISSLGLTSRQEQSLFDSLLRRVAQSPGMSLESLGAALSGPSYTPEQVVMRAVRCVKYGLLRFIDEPT